MAFTQRFDMRHISRKAFVDVLRRMDQDACNFYQCAAVDRVYHFAGTEAVVEWTPAKSITAIGVEKFAAELARGAQEINQRGKMANNVTGARALGDHFRSLLAEIKRDIDQTTSDMSAAMTDLKDTAGQAKEMVKAVRQETADLKSSLGIHSNNAPGDA